MAKKKPMSPEDSAALKERMCKILGPAEVVAEKAVGSGFHLGLVIVGNDIQDATKDLVVVSHGSETAVMFAAVRNWLARDPKSDFVKAYTRLCGYYHGDQPYTDGLLSTRNERRREDEQTVLRYITRIGLPDPAAQPV